MFLIVRVFFLSADEFVKGLGPNTGPVGSIRTLDKKQRSSPHLSAIAYFIKNASFLFLRYGGMRDEVKIVASNVDGFGRHRNRCDRMMPVLVSDRCEEWREIFVARVIERFHHQIDGDMFPDASETVKLSVRFGHSYMMNFDSHFIKNIMNIQEIEKSIRNVRDEDLETCAADTDIRTKDTEISSHFSDQTLYLSDLEKALHYVMKKGDGRERGERSERGDKNDRGKREEREEWGDGTNRVTDITDGDDIEEGEEKEKGVNGEGGDGGEERITVEDNLLIAEGEESEKKEEIVVTRGEEREEGRVEGDNAEDKIMDVTDSPSHVTADTAQIEGVETVTTMGTEKNSIEIGDTADNNDDHDTENDYLEASNRKNDIDNEIHESDASSGQALTLSPPIPFIPSISIPSSPLPSILSIPAIPSSSPSSSTPSATLSTPSGLNIKSSTFIPSSFIPPTPYIPFIPAIPVTPSSLDEVNEMRVLKGERESGNLEKDSTREGEKESDEKETDEKERESEEDHEYQYDFENDVEGEDGEEEDDEGFEEGFYGGKGGSDSKKENEEKRSGNEKKMEGDKKVEREEEVEGEVDQPLHHNIVGGPNRPSKSNAGTAANGGPSTVAATEANAGTDSHTAPSTSPPLPSIASKPASKLNPNASSFSFTPYPSLLTPNPPSKPAHTLNPNASNFVMKPALDSRQGPGSALFINGQMVDRDKVEMERRDRRERVSEKRKKLLFSGFKNSVFPYKIQPLPFFSSPSSISSLSSSAATAVTALTELSESECSGERKDCGKDGKGGKNSDESEESKNNKESKEIEDGHSVDGLSACYEAADRWIGAILRSQGYVKEGEEKEDIYGKDNIDGKEEMEREGMMEEKTHREESENMEESVTARSRLSLSSAPAGAIVVHLLDYLFDYLSVLMPICPSMCLYAYLSLCLSA